MNRVDFSNYKLDESDGVFTYKNENTTLGFVMFNDKGEVEYIFVNPIFRKKGIRVDYRRDKVSRNIANGITHMRTWFEDAAGNTHFYADPRAEKFISSFENYRYPEKKKDQRLKEEPLKDGLNCHANDASRYFFCNLFPIKSRTAGTVDW